MTPISAEPTAAEVAAQLSASFRELCKTLAQLQPEEIDSGRMNNGWCPKALLAHIAFWDEAQTARMQALLRGQPLPRNIREAWQANDQRAREDESKSLAQVLATAELNRQRMVDFVGNLDVQIFHQELTEGERTLSPLKLFQHMVRHTQGHHNELSDYCGSLDRWTRQSLRRFIIQQYTTLMDSIGGLDEATILTTKVCGTWSIRDVLTHVLSWNEYEYKVLKGWPDPKLDTIAEWKFQEQETTDSINARLLAARSDLDMIAIVDWLTTYHRKVLRLFDKANDEELSSTADIDWGRPFAMSGFIYSMSMHDLEHAEDIWKWKAERVVL
ncbi:MAG: DinB family protein [Caldilineaceae bacterium]